MKLLEYVAVVHVYEMAGLGAPAGAQTAIRSTAQGADSTRPMTRCVCLNQV